MLWSRRSRRGGQQASICQNFASAVQQRVAARRAEACRQQRTSGVAEWEWRQGLAWRGGGWESGA